MDKKIVWTFRATKSFEKILDYLQLNWTDKEIQNLVNSTNSVLNLLKSNRVKFRSSGKRPNEHEVLITKHNLLIYRIGKNHIELIMFFDTRRHPKKKRG